MQTSSPGTTLEQPFDNVKSSQPPLFDLPSDPMIHHKPPSLDNKIIVSYQSIQRGDRYGVSKYYRVLSPGLLLKKYDLVRDCLASPLGLTRAQKEVVMRLLRLWAYYGYVYPKESQITEDPGCSKATFWRTIGLLKQLGLVVVVNRYVIRPHAQISNLYRFDKLLLLLARYLAEHGTGFLESWLKPILTMPGREFWSKAFRHREVRAGPLLPAGA